MPRPFQLRDYQRDGVRWLRYNYAQRRSVILGDEMGLGKTLQARMQIAAPQVCAQVSSTAASAARGLTTLKSCFINRAARAARSWPSRS